MRHHQDWIDTTDPLPGRQDCGEAELIVPSGSIAGKAGQ